MVVIIPYPLSSARILTKIYDAKVWPTELYTLCGILYQMFLPCHLDFLHLPVLDSMWKCIDTQAWDLWQDWGPSNHPVSSHSQGRSDILRGIERGHLCLEGVELGSHCASSTWGWWNAHTLTHMHTQTKKKSIFLWLSTLTLECVYACMLMDLKLSIAQLYQ